jgi:pimeloyl-ACP methyl ester carboxylesterase
MPELKGVEHTYVDLPGLRMHVATAGAGEPVLLLHGFPQHWWEWRDVLPRLAEHYRVIAPDLRGAGWTDAPADGYTRARLSADLLDLLDHLGLDRVRLVAHDWSAILGFQLCLDHPDRVQQYLCLATPHPWIRFRPRLLPGLWRLWFQPVIATPGLGARLLGRGRQSLARHLLEQHTANPWSERDLDVFLAPLRDPAYARAGSALYRSLILPEIGRIARGAYRDRRLTTPTRVLYGADDPGTGPDLVGGYEAHADDLAVEFVAGAAHFLADDRPDAVADHAVTFFGARSGAAGGTTLDR